MTLAAVPGGRLTIASHFPGRLRVRAAAFRDGELGDEVAERLAKEPGVHSAVITKKTGSLLVEYDAHRMQLPSLVQAIVRFGAFDGLEVDHDGKPLRPHGPLIRGALDRWNNVILEATNNRLDGKSAMPGILASLGVAKLLFGNRRLPEWYDLMFWSFTTFVNLNPPAVVIDTAPGHEHGGSVH